MSVSKFWCLNGSQRQAPGLDRIASSSDFGMRRHDHSQASLLFLSRLQTSKAQIQAGIMVMTKISFFSNVK